MILILSMCSYVKHILVKNFKRNFYHKTVFIKSLLTGVNPWYYYKNIFSKSFLFLIVQTPFYNTFSGQIFGITEINFPNEKSIFWKMWKKGKKKHSMVVSYRLTYCHAFWNLEAINCNYYECSRTCETLIYFKKEGQKVPNVHM